MGYLRWQFSSVRYVAVKVGVFLFHIFYSQDVWLALLARKEKPCNAGATDSAPILGMKLPTAGEETLPGKYGYNNLSKCQPVLSLSLTVHLLGHKSLLEGIGPAIL
jgi:hypothetical protein